MLKNLARFYKNPIGFVGWRYHYAAKMNNAYSLWYLISAVFIYSIVDQIGRKQESTYNNSLLSDEQSPREVQIHERPERLFPTKRIY